MSHPVVSVTVPVYNTSKYLRTCLDSLRMQTLKDIEYILVDDGSTDDSGLICDEYARKDSRFRVIHQKNGGLASPVKLGSNRPWASILLFAIQMIGPSLICMKIYI